ncbi:amidase [Corynebacterium sp. sy017]|uniref:amidase n=2 Tax=unclassified Corynebacterium TaxID=2624378 RepID=UPI0011865668|nr:amidase [Corynebacterium sp. sy017]TSD90869.1 amidase [Corynebacterium sp. SY003]
MPSFQDLHELVDAHRKDVDKLMPQEHGYSFFAPDYAHEYIEHQHWRERHDDSYRSPLRVGRLAGWLIPAKDLSDVAGLPTSFGSVQRTRWADKTDEFIDNYLQQGALVPGKTLTPELGLCAYTEPVGLPAPENPLYPGATPGGSTGGGAAMVARGLVRAAHASDGGGSIRVPAAACGIVGFKPAHDTAGANPVVQGFVCRSVHDCAWLYPQVPAAKTGVGTGARAKVCADNAQVAGKAQVHRPLRIGVLSTPVHAEVEVSEDMLIALDYTARILGQAGHEVYPVARPYGDQPFQAFHDVLSLRCATIRGEASPLVSWLRERGQSLSEQRAAQARQIFLSVDSLLRTAWDCDLLLTPTLAFDPPPVGFFAAQAPPDDFYTQTQWTPWATMFNMSGGAALSMPVPLSGRPPVGIHLGAIHGSTADIFAAAYALDAAAAPHQEVNCVH